MNAQCLKTDNDIKRKTYLDITRIIAIILVILCHSTEHIYSMYNTDIMNIYGMFSITACFTLFSLGRLGVPFFLFLTGYLMLPRKWDNMKIKDFYIKKWFRLLLCSMIWFLIYDIILYVVQYNQSFSIEKLIEESLFLKEFCMPHFWYIPMILGIYLILPVVGIGIQSVEVKLLRFPLLLSFIILFIYPLIVVLLPFFGITEIVSKVSSGFIGTEYIYYVLIGYVFFKTKNNIDKRNKLITVVCLVMALVFLACAVGLQMWFYSKGCLIRVWYNSPFVFGCSSCLFYVFTKLDIQKKSRIIESLSRYSFGVFLLHYLFIILFKPIFIDLSISKSLKCILFAIFVCILSYVVVWVVSKIPKIGKILLYL